jgi:ABC-type phosphate transport system substrate-binding protein
MRKTVRCLAAFAAALSALTVTATSDERGSSPALAVVVHKSSPFDGLTSGALRKVLAGELSQWPDSRNVVLVQQAPESPIYQQMLRLILHTDLKAYKRHLIQIEFQGKELPLIKTLSSDEMAIKFVGNVPGAIAVVDYAAVAGAASRIKVLRIDGKFPGERGYPLQ